MLLTLVASTCRTLFASRLLLTAFWLDGELINDTPYCKALEYDLVPRRKTWCIMHHAGMVIDECTGLGTGRDMLLSSDRCVLWRTPRCRVLELSGRSSTSLRHANQKGANVQSMNIPGVEQHVYPVHTTHYTVHTTHYTCMRLYTLYTLRALCSTQP